MEKRIELEKRGRKANQITDLNLDNCRSTLIVGLTDEYTALEFLSLINVGLTTLKGFPKLPNLKKLELSDNRICNGLNYLTTSPKLHYLNLSGNKIKDLETLKPLEEFKNLAILDLFNNEATQIDDYREKIFKMLPSLQYLDGFDCNDVEAPSDGDDEEDGIGMQSDDDSDDTGDDDEDGGDDDDDDDDDDADSDDEENVSLAEVYNDDLEDDNFEWDKEDGAEEEDDDDSDDDELDGEANESAATANDSKVDGEAAGGDEEPQSRGKKRKHDG